MYSSIKSDLAQKKKRQAIRRLSQSGRKGPSPPQQRGRGSTFLRGRGRGISRGTSRQGIMAKSTQQLHHESSTQGENPFLTQTAGPGISSGIQKQGQEDNPFFAAMAKPDKPVRPATQPPSYASIVSGGRGIETGIPQVSHTQPKGPVPKFITHGPDSVPVSGIGMGPSSIPTCEAEGPVFAISNPISNPFLAKQPQQMQPYGGTTLGITPQMPLDTGGLYGLPHGTLPQGGTAISSMAPVSLGDGQMAPISLDTGQMVPISLGDGQMAPVSLGDGQIVASSGRGMIIGDGQIMAGLQKVPPPPSYAVASNENVGNTNQQQPQNIQTLRSSSYDPKAVSFPLKSQPVAVPSNTTLHVKGVPPRCNNPPFLKKHFVQFGSIKLIKCNPSKMFATVEFVKSEDAARAKSGGKQLSPDLPPVKIFWNAERNPQVKNVTFTRRDNPFVYAPGNQNAETCSQSNGIPIIEHQPRMQQQTNRDSSEFEGEENRLPVLDGSQDLFGDESTQSLGNNLSQEQPLQQGAASVIPSVQIKKGILKSVAYVAKKSALAADSGSKTGRIGVGVAKGGAMSGRGGGVKGKSIWERLGDKVEGDDMKKAKSHDQEWTPPTGDGVDGGAGEESDSGEEDKERKRDGVRVRRNILDELGNKYTGDEMDTIAKTAQHGYYLRSLNQPGAYSGPTGGGSSSGGNLQISITHYQEEQDSGTVESTCYNIPVPMLPDPPRPKGNAAGDYYEALNVRDQEIRKGMVKATSLDQARVIVGTCPDMCPEKERYRREETRRLSWFEICLDNYEPRNAQVDHRLAIKEYSGSAADKEEPLPHDLRPLGVLQMTMDYLVTMVMDRCAEKPAEWYDFVWNRTRGIRKDITIQHLSSPECVELTEKCSRFHILCAHHLCEEEITTFDPKLNNENLNKCLLSLKEFYRDIRTGKVIL